ncbi:hypothetical protein [Rhodopirellula europaea]|uniref:hypothetical protein n=1 Tax=Rhodopirellula europaea TaxID=1263866 RepID=UPI003D2A55B5
MNAIRPERPIRYLKIAKRIVPLAFLIYLLPKVMLAYFVCGILDPALFTKNLLNKETIA